MKSQASPRIRRFVFVALALAIWLASTAYRNRNNPQVRHLAWENDGPTCTVNCEIWNPQEQPITVKAFMRLVSPGGVDAGLGPLIGAEQEFVYQIGAKSHLKIQEDLRRINPGKPEVRLLVIPSTEEIAVVSGLHSFKKNLK